MAEEYPLTLEQADLLPPKPIHLAIGMFDGVHLGHRAVIDAAVRTARNSGGAAVVLTFHPHPSAVLGSPNPTRLIMDAASKARILRSAGVDAVIVEPFTPEFARIKAEAFVPLLHSRIPRLACLYVGENWRFGADRVGDLAMLNREARALELPVFSSPRVAMNGEPISSTRIRALLQAGDVESASVLLGYPYFSDGKVVPGRRLGRTIGFPTLNLEWNPDFRPRIGVYAARVSGPKCPMGLPAVMNYGLRPTVGGIDSPVLEAHLLVPQPFGEGDTITVEWLRFFRPEMKFSGLDELKVQIATDVSQARDYFVSRGGV